MYKIIHSSTEMRSGKDRRRLLNLSRSRYKGSERRVFNERRLQIERRDGWVRFSKWSSVKIQDLKIAKYLQ